MTLQIRRLDPATDAPLFEQSYRWLMDGPAWRRETEAVFNTLDHDAWLAAPATPGRIDVGVFIDGQFVADIVLVLRARQIYEVHFDARRGTPLDLLIEAGRDVRDQMFRYGMLSAFTWTPHWNRAILAVNKAVGFRDTGVSMFRGTVRGKLIQWMRWEIVR